MKITTQQVGIKLLLLLFYAISSTNYAYAQKQGNNWYFGETAGITFNTSPPSALTDGQLDTDEGCASISDAEGQLLFYTDGVSVWDKNHNLMPNGTGLAGDTSSTQSAIIVPNPEDSSQYYIFTVDNNIGSGGFRYSLVEMDRNGGNGAVLSSEKNRLLFAPATEKITAVQHKNGRDVWLIAHAWNSDAFYVYRIGTFGLSSFPFVQSVGTAHEGVNRNAHGYMKASPDGKKLAVGIGETGICEIFDFDNQSGRIGNVRRIDGYDYIYGLEFSPNSEKLFLSFRYETDIHGFDITAGSSSAIEASRFIITTQFPIGALQLGPDERIYASKRENSLGVIFNPNADPASINYLDQGIELQGRVATLGLPTFVQSFFQPVLFRVNQTCFGNDTEFIPLDTQFILSIDWDFDDPQSGANNTSREISPKHTFSQPGTYDVEADVVLTNGTQRRYIQTVVIQTNDFEAIDLGEEILVCPGEPLLYDFELDGNQTFQWTSDQWPEDSVLVSSYFPITEPGKYFLTVFNDCGTFSDSVLVRTQAYGDFLPTRYLICPGIQDTLSAAVPGAISYEWLHGSTDSLLITDTPGNYEVTIQTQSGCEIIKSTYLDTLAFTYIGRTDTIRICRGQEIELGNFELESGWKLDEFDNFDEIQFIWGDGFTGPTKTFSNPANNQTLRYENDLLLLSLNDLECISINQFTLEYRNQDPPTFALPDSVIYCEGDTAVLDATIANAIFYQWFTVNDEGEADESLGNDPILRVPRPGVYCVIVSDGVCTSYKIVTVIRQNLPRIFLYDEVLCDEPDAFTYLDAYYANDTDENNPVSYLWDDGSTRSFRRVDSVGIYTVTVTNSCGSVTDSVEVRLNAIDPPVVELGADTTLCEGQTLLLNARQPSSGRYFYRWQDGDFSSTYRVRNPGRYIVRVSNGCDVIRDTIDVAFRKVPEVEFNDEEYLCNGNNLTLNAGSAEATYAWFDEANNLLSVDSAIVVSKPGKYRVKIQDPCFEVEYEALVLPLDNAFDLGPNLELCQADSVVLGVPTLQGVTYLWQDSSRQSTFTVRESGTYWLEIAQEGCTYRDSVQINLLSVFDLDIGADQSLCPGDSLALDIGFVSGQYKWFDGSNQLISEDSLYWVTQPGTYRLEFDNGCRQGADTIQVFDIPVSLNLGEDRISCTPQSQTLDATISPDTSLHYIWNTGDSTAVITVDTAGSYWVEVQFQSCTLRDTIQVAFLEDWVLNLGPDTLLCPQEGYVLEPANPSPQAQYLWSDGSTDPFFHVQAAGTYWVNVQDNCTNQTDTVQINFRNSPQVDLGPDLNLCPSEVKILDVQDANPSVTYLWQDGSTSPQFTVDQTGSYWVEKDDGICTVRDTVNILYELPIPEVSLGADTILCPGTQMELQVGFDGRDLDYLWSDGTKDSLLTIQAPGTYIVAVSNFCETRYDTLIVDYYEFPQVDLGPDTLLCPGDILTLDAQNPAGALYNWSVAGQSGPQLSVSTAGTYWVDVTLGTCTFRDSITVRYKTVLELDLGPDLNICAGDTLPLVASNPFATYVWQGDTTINNDILLVTEPGTYWVVVDNGCETISDTVQIGFVPRPVLNLGNDTVLCFQESLVLSAENGEDVTYSWSDGSDQPELLVKTSGLYSVEVQRADCIVFDEIEVTFTDCFEDLVPYNVITPNGDGLNENFEIPKLDLSQWTFQIFNRHGNEVYKSDNYQNDWTCKDHPQGVYFYVLRSKVDGRELKGWIQVLK